LSTTPGIKKILCVVGTRPEAIKMAPVIQRLRDVPGFEVRVLATAQHREMLDQVLSLFGITPDADLDIMQPDQRLPELTARLITGIDRVLQQEKPDAVLAQGDTTTVMAVALSCYYHRIPFGHVEAGLRTHNRYNPFPEEMNRVVAGHLATWHFAPTERAKSCLLREGIPEDAILVTGNTVIDALLQVAEGTTPADIGVDIPEGKRLILVTAHRRENFGTPFAQICRAVRRIADENPDVQVLYPVHPNPNIHAPAHALLGEHPRIRLCAPLDYKPFVAAMKRSHLILTDSGGVQEEAPALGKPVLVLRNETERPEAVEMGVVELVGVDAYRILTAAQNLLTSEEAYRRMAKGGSPYGDGRAAQRIAETLVLNVPVSAADVSPKATNGYWRQNNGT
jgi:UDP-N-acetylglucosamine 2-epimerase (non-hydrolysing)